MGHFFVQHSTQRLLIPNRAEPVIHRTLSTATWLDFGLASFLIQSNTIPKNVAPAKLTNLRNNYRLNQNSTSPCLGSQPPESQVTSFLEYLRQLSDWQQELLAGVFQTLNYDTLGQHLLQGDHLSLCSADSGTKDNDGSFGEKD